MIMVLLDIFLCFLTYAILMYIIFWKRPKRSSEDEDGDDGGIPEWTEPELDLPPGVSLPSNGPTYKKDVYEDTLV